MILQLIFLQLLVHIVSDFYLPSGDLSPFKDTSVEPCRLIVHVACVFILSWIIVLTTDYLFYALTIAIFHGLIDGCNKHLKSSTHIGQYAFFIDQFAHCVVIIIVSVLYCILPNEPGTILCAVTWHVILVIGILLCLNPANIIIKEILFCCNIQDKKSDEDLPNAGKLIGITERLLVFILVLSAQFEVIGFLMTAKSILRYKTGAKAEYVVVGTMLSWCIAIFMALLVVYVKNTNYFVS